MARSSARVMTVMFGTRWHLNLKDGIKQCDRRRVGHWCSKLMEMRHMAHDLALLSMLCNEIWGLLVDVMMYLCFTGSSVWSVVTGEVEKVQSHSKEAGGWFLPVSLWLLGLVKTTG